MYFFIYFQSSEASDKFNIINAEIKDNENIFNPIRIQQKFLNVKIFFIFQNKIKLDDTCKLNISILLEYYKKYFELSEKV